MEKVKEKTYQFLLKLLESNRDYDYGLEILKTSELFIVEKTTGFPVKRHLYLKIMVDPDTYLRKQNLIKEAARLIAQKFEDVTNLKLQGHKAIPELSKFQILTNPVKLVLTEWQEINGMQEVLLNQLQRAANPIDFQNIGNTSRTILQRLANEVFKRETHKAPEKIDLSESKFKNRLHTYIKCELGGEQNDELKEYISSLVTTAEKAIDLSNKTTHDLKAYRLMAETCVISVVTVISIIRLISKHKI